jgi:opacity protein-like surface antigen
MRGFIKSFGVIAAAAALLVTMVPAASAAPLKDADGAPDINGSSPTGYYIWHTDDGWHLRTHGPGAQHDFDAVLRTNGTFENLDVVKLEAGDSVNVVDGGHKMVIHFHTFDLTDGVNFTVRDGERLRFNLKLDDKQASTSDIFLGAQGRHPKHNPFRIKL